MDKAKGITPLPLPMARDQGRPDAPAAPSVEDGTIEDMAHKMIDRHGYDQATIEATRCVRDSVSKGDQAGCQRWLQVLETIRNWYEPRQPERRQPGMIYW